MRVGAVPVPDEVSRTVTMRADPSPTSRERRPPGRLDRDRLEEQRGRGVPRHEDRRSRGQVALADGPDRRRRQDASAEQRLDGDRAERRIVREERPVACTHVGHLDV
jgi:hypothetical protein